MKMKLFVALLSFLLMASAQAEELQIPIPGEKWGVQFDGPRLTKVEAKVPTSGRVYAGTSGSLNLSLHVSVPDCEGDDSAENLYNCFGQKIQRVPYIVNGSIAVGRAPDGIQVTYLMEAPLNDRKVRVFNLNYVFAKNGKWGDLHISVVQPTKADLESAVTIMKSLKFTSQE